MTMYFCIGRCINFKVTTLVFKVEKFQKVHFDSIKPFNTILKNPWLLLSAGASTNYFEMWPDFEKRRSTRIVCSSLKSAK